MKKLRSPLMLLRKKNPHFIKSGAGFTLVELLVYMGIVTIAMLIFTSFMADVTRSAAKTRAIKEVSQNARLILSRITNDIRHADSAAVNGGGSLELISGPITASYLLSGDVVQYDNDIADGIAAVGISNDKVLVKRLDFFNELNSNSITIDLAVNPKTPISGASEVALSSSVVPRRLLY